MTELVRWDHKLKCKGYFGFGGGYAKVKGYTYEDGSGIYCNVCPIARECWDSHKDRTRKLFPKTMGAMDELIAKGLNGSALMKAWMELSDGNPPPDISLNAGNIEDGSMVAATGKPKDRGPYTLTWPLEPR